jgi:hypothetical protein
VVDRHPGTGSAARVVGQPETYDQIGLGYAEERHPDPRLARRITAALGGACSVLNVGAGAGSYEPADRFVVAVEPSGVMLAQRPLGAAPAIRAAAEQLPFPDASFEAVMAILTVHHWSDREAGYAELCRVSPHRVVLTFDPMVHNQNWFLREYVPDIALFEQQRAPSIDEIARGIGATQIESVPIPHDCTDGFTVAYWRRPHAYLDPNVRRGHSGIAQADPAVVERGIERLREDLSTGRWHETHASILELNELDVGIRIIVA